MRKIVLIAVTVMIVSVFVSGITLSQEGGSGKKRKENIRKLKEQLKDSDAKVRALAVYGLGHLGAKDAVPDIKLLLKDDDAEVRREVIRAFINLEVKDAASDIKPL